MARVLYFLLFLPFLLSTSACVKEGCTDEDAINYDANADDDDGSCVYKDTLKQEFKDDERDVYTFTLDWDGDVAEGYKLPISLENKSVLLYMKHPDYSEEWTKMPFTRKSWTYYYTEDQEDRVVWVYIEDVGTGTAVKNSGTTEHKAVILTNSFLKENPDVKEMSYPEMEEAVLEE